MAGVRQTTEMHNSDQLIMGIFRYNFSVELTRHFSGFSINIILS